MGRMESAGSLLLSMMTVQATMSGDHDDLLVRNWQMTATWTSSSEIPGPGEIRANPSDTSVVSPESRVECGTTTTSTLIG